MIRDELIKQSFGYNADVEKNVSIAFRNIEGKRFLDKGEYMQLSNAGLPLIPIISNVLQVPAIRARQMIDERAITYDDMLCVLGIIAQDRATIKQRKG